MDLPVGAEIAGCLVEAEGCNQCGCPSGTGTAGSSCPGQNESLYAQASITQTIF